MNKCTEKKDSPNLVESYKKWVHCGSCYKKRNTYICLGNIIYWNLMSKQELEKAIKDTIIKYKDIIFRVNSAVSIKCLD